MALDSNHPLHRLFHFRAMNTQIEFMVSGGPEEPAYYYNLASDWFRYAEERFSRFLEKSELSHLNRLAGETCLVSETMLEVLTLADNYRQLTDGIFNPLIYEALSRSGYDDTFDHIRNGTAPKALSFGPPVETKNLASLSIQPAMRSVRLPASSGIDLGGIVKGWAVKRLADYFKDTLQVPRGLINAGGDLTFWGGAEDAAPWTVEIEHPWQEQTPSGRIVRADGAAATSSKLGRRWNTDQGVMHHLIDPRTMRPSDSDVVQCTVSGGKDSDTVACEIWAKVLCILGTKEGLTLLRRRAVPYEALLFTADRQTHFFGNPDSLGTIWREVPVDHIHIHRGPANYPRYEGGTRS